MASYLRSAHFADTLDRAQGKDTEIPDSLVVKLRSALSTHDPLDVCPETVRDELWGLGVEGKVYLEHYVAAYVKVMKIPEADCLLSADDVSLVRRAFEVVVATHNLDFEGEPFPSYGFILAVICDRYEIECIGAKSVRDFDKAYLERYKDLFVSATP